LKEDDPYLSRNFKWNFIACSLDNGLFMTALSMLSTTTILPAFVVNLTPSYVLIGLISTVSVAGWSLPQVFGAHYVAKFPVKKDMIVVVTALERAPWFLFGLFLMLFPSTEANAMLALFFLVFSTTSVVSGLLTPAWLEMIAKIIPTRWRGKFFGFSFFVGSAVGMFGGLLAGYLLESHSFPNGFAYCFVVAFCLQVGSWVFLAMVREPEDPVAEEATSFRRYLADLPSILRSDRNFELYLISSIVLSLGALGSPFYIVAAINELEPSGELIGLFTALYMGGQTFTNVLWGLLGDRYGHKKVLQLGAILELSTSALAAIASSASTYGLVFLLHGASLSALTVSGMSIVLEFSTPEKRPIYVGLVNTLRSPFQALAPLLGGALADVVPFRTIFLTGAAIMAMGLTLLLLVREPRRAIALKTELRSEAAVSPSHAAQHASPDRRP